MGESISKSCCIASDYQDLTATQSHHGHEIITTIRVPKIRRETLLYQDSFDREKRRLEAQILSEEKEAKKCILHKKQLDSAYWNKRWKKIVEDKDYAKIVRAELARKNEEEKNEAETASCSWKPRIPTSSRKMTANTNSRIRSATMASRNLAFCSEDNKSIQEWQESLRKPDSKKSAASTATTNPIKSKVERKETTPIRKSCGYFLKGNKDDEYLDIPDETELGNTLSTNATAFMESTNLDDVSDNDLPRYCSSPVPSVRLPDIQPALVQPLIQTATRPEQPPYQPTFPQHTRQPSYHGLVPPPQFFNPYSQPFNPGFPYTPSPTCHHGSKNKMKFRNSFQRTFEARVFRLSRGQLSRSDLPWELKGKNIRE